MYHGILIDQEFTNKSFPKTFKIFAKKQVGSWGIYGVEIEDSQLEKSIKKIQENMKDKEPWYSHLYNNTKLIVIFKNKVFRAVLHVSSLKPIIDYGKKLNIPEEQLDFRPKRFQDEKDYFKKS